MLVLGRAPGESIVILCAGRTIEVTLSSISHFHQQVRLGFEADKDIKIYRKELLHNAHDPERGDL